MRSGWALLLLLALSGTAAAESIDLPRALIVLQSSPAGFDERLFVSALTTQLGRFGVSVMVAQQTSASPTVQATTLVKQTRVHVVWVEVSDDAAAFTLVDGQGRTLRVPVGRLGAGVERAAALSCAEAVRGVAPPPVPKVRKRPAPRAVPRSSPRWELALSYRVSVAGGNGGIGHGPLLAGAWRKQRWRLGLAFGFAWRAARSIDLARLQRRSYGLRLEGGWGMPLGAGLVLRLDGAIGPQWIAAEATDATGRKQSTILRELVVGASASLRLPLQRVGFLAGGIEAQWLPLMHRVTVDGRAVSADGRLIIAFFLGGGVRF